MFNLVADGCEAISEIFDLEISQKEGELAIAQVQVRSSIDFSSLAGKEARIMRDNETLCAGTIQEYPSHIDQDFMTIRLVSSFNAKELEQIVDNFKRSDAYNSVFDADVHDVSCVTEAIPARVRFSRLSDEVSLSEIYPQSSNYELAPDDYWQFKIRKVRDSYLKVNVFVTAQWIQTLSGIIDLFPLIADLFPGKHVNSINNIANHWWKMMRSLPRSCYAILNSKLREEHPPSASLSEEFDIDGTKVRVKRFWFKGMLDLVWNYRQKMEETVQFSICNQSLATESNNVKNLHFNLGAVPANEPSFFKTPEGISCLKSAAQRAFNHILAAQRNIEITLSGDFNKLHMITVGDSVAINNQYVSTVGKVTHTFLKISDSERYVKLKIAASLTPKPRLPDTQTFFESHLDKWSVDGALLDGNVVEDIAIENPPDVQITAAKDQKFKSVAELKSFLSRLPTKIRIKLKNLNTVKCLKHELQIEDELKV